MIVSERKPIEEILSFLEGDDNIFIVVCEGCPEGCESGTPEEVERLVSELEEGGKKVVGTAAADFLCNKLLIARRLAAHMDELQQADALLVVSCGIGVQAVSATVDLPANPALDTISMGGFQGLWPGDERCFECGECVLHYTGGICPRTACSKSLVNGACGGTQSDGSCEVSHDIPCGWRLIYERQEALGRLDNLKKFIAAPNYDKLRARDADRPTTWWAIENKLRAPVTAEEEVEN